MSSRAPDPAPREIVIDDRSPRARVSTGAGPALLFGLGLAVTALFLFKGSQFLFLPIILPFGLGGGSVLGRLGRRFRRRVLVVDSRGLTIETRGLLRRTRQGPLDPASGVFVDVDASGVWVSGAEATRVCLVGGTGVLSFPLGDSGSARALRDRITAELELAGVRAATREEALRGRVTSRDHGTLGVALEWTSDGEGRSWMTPLLFVVALGLLPAAWLLGRTELGLAEVLVVAGLLALLVWILPSGGKRTLVSANPYRWQLRSYSGKRLLAMTEGTGRLEARLATGRSPDPFGSGFVRSEHWLELVNRGEIVAEVGAGLSLPELRYLAERLGSATG